MQYSENRFNYWMVLICSSYFVPKTNDFLGLQCGPGENGSFWEWLVPDSREEYYERIDLIFSGSGAIGELGSKIADLPDWDFSKACQAHDDCYSKCQKEYLKYIDIKIKTSNKNRTQCDQDWLKRMKKSCKNKNSTIENIKGCEDVALVYYNAVHPTDAGKRAYCKAQAKHGCCRPPECKGKAGEDLSWPEERTDKVEEETFKCCRPLVIKTVPPRN